MDPGPWGMGTNVKALGSGMKGGQEDPSVAMRGVKGRDDTTGVTIEDHWMSARIFFATMCGQTRRALVPWVFETCGSCSIPYGWWGCGV